MIDFMVVSLPRSGSTWISNWLTTDTSFCLHDPLRLMHYSQWDDDTKHLPHGTFDHVGVACTAIRCFPEFLNNHPAKKLVIHRDLDDVNKSLKAIGWQPIKDDRAAENLYQLDGMHIHYNELFTPDGAEAVWAYVLERRFCEARYRAAVEINMQPYYKTQNNALVQTRIVNELGSAIDLLPCKKC